MTDLRTLLTEGLRPGVYRWPSKAAVDGVRRDATAAGFGFVLLDTAEIHDKTGFLDLCATAFDLPRWFGRNWDALADSLSDRSTGAPEVVLWTGLPNLLEHDHDTVDVALQIFAEDTTNSGQLRVLIREQAGARTPDLLSSLPVL
ncbi:MULTISPECIES: barstar family protein [Kribbella]|uniref:RNAse (Barnase) inhibitor barstar n=2 Tax=Kribbella TaxID=182639 RepID=A0A841DME9_9ACTN|nr:barstar family protein [Kribbella solani]MBB5979061.1 RNAse (barnase) inhibitor barstar [Kribbella solani]MDX2970632.1 barstar family protein [Kribbella solani]MDX3000222.1 barstar family protein [Kribbella solani]